MWMMHTKLPEFISKMKTAAATTGEEPKECLVVGLEHLKSAKMQSMRTGRIERAVTELTRLPDVSRLEVAILPRVPETMHTVVIRGFDSSGAPAHAILETINILHGTEEQLTHDCPDVQDRRARIGNH